MAAADIIARLRINGSEFANDFRSAMSGIETAAQSAANRVGGAFAGIGNRIKSAADSASVFEQGKAAADRMRASVDPLFAAQLRYNQSMQQANELQATGMLVGENYRRVHAGLVAQLRDEISVQSRLNGISGQRRAGMQQLSFQIGDVATQMASGTAASIIFAQQSGQVIQALQLMAGEGNAFLRFLGGPWGIAISAAAVVLAPLIGRLFDTRTELQKATDELQDNARKAELNRQAQEIYAQTLPGVITRIREQTQALAEQNRTLQENQLLVLNQRRADLQTQRQNLDGVQEELASARGDLARVTAERDRLLRANDFRTDPGYVNNLNVQIDGLRARIAQMERDEAAIRGSILRAAQGATEALIPIARDEAERQVDPIKRITDAYADRARQAERAATATVGMTVAQRNAAIEAARILPQTLAGIYRERDAALAAERARQSAARTRQRAENRDYSQVPFSDVRSRIIANEAPARVGGYNALAFNLPGGGNAAGVRAPQQITTMTIGQIINWQGPVRNPGADTMRYLTQAYSRRTGNGDPRGSTGVGAYQFERSTLEENARLTFGDNWRNQLFTPENQDRIAETLYNRVRGNPRQLRNTWAAFSGRPGTGGSGGDAASAANAAAEAAGREATARAQILQDMEQATDQSAQQARLADMRAQGLDREADTEEALGRVRQQAAARMEQLQRNLAQLRTSAAQPADIAAAEAAVAAQSQVTAGLQEQLTLYEQQSAAFAQMVVQHREDGKVSAEELAAERALSDQKNATLQRAQQIGHTVVDTQKIQESQVRTEAQLNATIEDGNQKREQARALAEQAAEEQQRLLDDMKNEMLQRQEDQIRQLADLYSDLFRGKIGDIWDRFKDAGLDVIAQLAAQWTLSMMSGQQFNVQGALQGMGQNGNPIASLLGGLFGGGKGGVKGPLDLGAMVPGPFGIPMMPGGAGAMGGMGGLMSGISSAMPYIGAAFAAFGILKSLGVFSSTKRGSTTLGYSGGELGAGATRGNSQDFIAASSSAMDSVGSSLERIAEVLGGNVTGAGSVSLGQRDGNWRGDPTGRGITKTKKGAIDFGDDQEAAVRWAISEALRDGVIGGISDAAKKILQSGKDLEKAIEKASMIESIPKLLKARLDPVGAALDELEEKWAKIIAALKEGGATAEQMAEAQQLYKLELEDTISQTKSASSTLKEFLDSLKMGSNSPYSLRDQEATARAALQPFLDKIAAGESINNDQYTQAAQTYLDIERQLYGSTEQFFGEMDRIMAATSQAIARIDSAVPIRTAVDPFVEATAANTQTLTEQMEVLTGLVGSWLGGGGGANDNQVYDYNTFIGGGGGFTGAAFD